MLFFWILPGLILKGALGFLCHCFQFLDQWWGSVKQFQGRILVPRKALVDVHLAAMVGWRYVSEGFFAIPCQILISLYVFSSRPRTCSIKLVIYCFRWKHSPDRNMKLGKSPKFISQKLALTRQTAHLPEKLSHFKRLWWFLDRPQTEPPARSTWAKKDVLPILRLCLLGQCQIKHSLNQAIHRGCREGNDDKMNATSHPTPTQQRSVSIIGIIVVPDSRLERLSSRRPETPFDSPDRATAVMSAVSDKSSKYLNNFLGKVWQYHITLEPKPL
jgi:hypothetical protein